MSKMIKVIFAVAVIGTIACAVSFIIALFREDNMMSTIYFGAGTFACFTAAVGAYKKSKR